jgi:hypothetical protein
MKEHDFATKIIDGLVEKLERLQKLEAAVVGSWMESCDQGSPWHKLLRYPCVDLGYLELRDVEVTREAFDGSTFSYTTREFHLKEEYEEMAKAWIARGEEE